VTGTRDRAAKSRSGPAAVAVDRKAVKLRQRAAKAPANAAKKDSASSDRSGPRRDILAGEVLDKAATLFTAKGFAATSLQDVADQVGLSRTAIYYYFDSKDALLQELVRGVTKQATQIFDDLDTAAGTSPADNVREAARRLVLWVTNPQTHFKLIDRSEHELPAATAAVHRQAKRRVLHGMSALIDAGIAAGEFRAADARIAAFAVIGMCNWVAWWFRPNGERSASEIAATVADQAVASLRRPDRQAARTDLGALTQAIRAELDLIDRMHVVTKKGSS
jgi:AcrR family transcriptional regulator